MLVIDHMDKWILLLLKPTIHTQCVYWEVKIKTFPIEFHIKYVLNDFMPHQLTNVCKSQAKYKKSLGELSQKSTGKTNSNSADGREKFLRITARHQNWGHSQESELMEDMNGVCRTGGITEERQQKQLGKSVETSSSLLYDGPVRSWHGWRRLKAVRPQLLALKLESQ